MSNYLIHSAKGSTWKDHKYIKKVGNTYIYPSIDEAIDKNLKKQYDENKEKYDTNSKLLDDITNNKGYRFNYSKDSDDEHTRKIKEFAEKEKNDATNEMRRISEEQIKRGKRKTMKALFKFKSK